MSSTTMFVIKYKSMDEYTYVLGSYTNLELAIEHIKIIGRQTKKVLYSLYKDIDVNQVTDLDIINFDNNPDEILGIYKTNSINNYTMITKEMIISNLEQDVNELIYRYTL